MKHPRTCPPSGPAWTLEELLLARDEISAAHRDAESSADWEWVLMAWEDWWLDVEATVPPGEWCNVIGRRRPGVPE